MKNDRFLPGMAAGAVLGGLIAFVLTAVAQQTPPPAKPPVPTEELRHFAEVYGAVKSNYVEPVDDRKLIVSCMTGMVGSLDGRSEFLDADSFRELRVGSGAPGDSGIGGIG